MTFKCLIVGAGGMGRAWGANLNEHNEVEIAGWIDLREGAAESASEDLSLSNVYTGTDLERALATLKPDFVVDVTVPEAHHDVTICALAAGIPVLGEKPMADSMERARAMVQASEKSGTMYMVSQSRRYNSELAAFRTLVNEKLGPLGMLNSDFYLGPHFGGFRDEMEHVLLLDMAIHTFDAARYVSGQDPVSVYCEEFNPAWSWYHGAASAIALFKMSGGLRYTFRGSWCAEGVPTSWDADWRAVGPNGSATWDGAQILLAETVAGNSGLMYPTSSVNSDIDHTNRSGISGSLEDFLHAMKAGHVPMGECHDNIKSLAMVFAAVESSVAGKEIKVQF